MPAMNKNWNDRADKDLFFTILSVKNIGVITGQEWTIIGNHMRTLGYGFTNEGCRQHFQGLRRAQNKVETNGGLRYDPGAKSVDPTVNPITRRPGPGRGRPRKQAPVLIASLNQSPTQDQQQQPSQPQQTQSQQPQQAPQGQQTLPSQDQQQASVQPTPPTSQAQAQSQAPAPPIQETPVPVPVIPLNVQPAAAGSQMSMQNNIQDDLNLEEHAEEDDEDEQAAKRPRLDPQLESSAEQVDDDVVLALAGHSSAQTYGTTEFDYGEA